MRAFQLFRKDDAVYLELDFLSGSLVVHSSPETFSSPLQRLRLLRPAAITKFVGHPVNLRTFPKDRHADLARYSQFKLDCCSCEATVDP